MNTSFFERIGGWAAVIAGFLFVAVELFLQLGGEGQAPSWLRPAIIISTFFALIGIYLNLRANAGFLALFGFLFSMLGNILIAVEFQIFLSLMLFSLGLVLLAVAMLRARSFPVWASWMWIAAPIIGTPVLILPNLESVFLIAAAVANGLGFLGAGLHLIRQ